MSSTHTDAPVRTTGATEPATVRILGISGSLRRASSNTTLLRAAAGLVGAGVRLDLWRELAALPPFNEDDEADPAPPVRAMRWAIADADALLIATPEYNSSIPGQLKNAVDWASRPYGEGVLTGKPVAVMGASPSPYGAAWAQAELRKSLTGTGARVLDREFYVARAHEAFGPDGRLRDPALQGALRGLLHDLGRAAGPIPEAA